MSGAREVYLGDGLFASWDGWQVKLRAPRENGDHEVYLDDATLTAFLQFLDTLPISGTREEITMPNRHERRRAAVTEVVMMTKAQFEGLGYICCWKGCDKTYDGGMPKGWQAIIMHGDPKPPLHIDEIKDWKRDGVLCPEHAEAVQSLLMPLALEVATRPSEGQA